MPKLSLSFLLKKQSRLTNQVEYLKADIRSLEIKLAKDMRELDKVEKQIAKHATNKRHS